MIGTVVLVILGTWLLLSIVTTVACAALARGGLQEDRARGYAPPQQRIPEPREPVAHR
jgi:hypothetical protein